jgi:uncharacterized protein (DUF1330 family)
MTAYWIGRVNVINQEGVAEYAKRAGPVILKHGGRFLARGGNLVTLEGKEYSRNVIIEFPSLDQAVGCYNSPEYQEAAVFLKGAAEREVCVVEGV